MKSIDCSFLERHAVPLVFAGTPRLLGEYRGKQEIYTRQTTMVRISAEALISPIFGICVHFPWLSQFSTRCVENCLGPITVCC